MQLVILFPSSLSFSGRPSLSLKMCVAFVFASLAFRIRICCSSGVVSISGMISTRGMTVAGSLDDFLSLHLSLANSVSCVRRLFFCERHAGALTQARWDVSSTFSFCTRSALPATTAEVREVHVSCPSAGVSARELLRRILRRFAGTPPRLSRSRTAAAQALQCRSPCPPCRSTRRFVTSPLEPAPCRSWCTAR